MSYSNFVQISQSPSGTLFIGVDIAKKKHYAAPLCRCNPKPGKAVGFANNRKGFDLFYKLIGKWCRRYNCNRIVIGMEPTSGYWEPLFCWLKARKFEVRLVSSLKVKHSKDIMDNSPLKSDQKDAVVIARLLKDDNTLDYRVRPLDEREVKTLLYTVASLDKTAGVYKNQLEQFLGVFFPELSGLFDELASPSVIALLREYPFPRDLVKANIGEVESLLWKASRGQIKKEKVKLLIETARITVGKNQVNEADGFQLKTILDMLEAALRIFKEAKSKLEKKVETMEQFAILDSIEGIGVITAAAIIAVLGDLREYGNARQVLKKAGLNIYSLSSGKHQGRDHISKRGRSILRRYLYMAALQHTHKGKTFYPKYRSIADSGKKKKKSALVAVMRKLLKVAFALVRDNRLFVSDYAHNHGAKRDVTVIRRAEAA